MAPRPLPGIAFLVLALAASAAPKAIRGATCPAVKVLFELDSATSNLTALENAAAFSELTVWARISEYKWLNSAIMGSSVLESNDSIATLVFFRKFEGDNYDGLIYLVFPLVAFHPVTMDTMTKAENDLRKDSAEIIDSVNSATNVLVTDAKVERADLRCSNDGNVVYYNLLDSLLDSFLRACNYLLSLITFPLACHILSGLACLFISFILLILDFLLYILIFLFGMLNVLLYFFGFCLDNLRSMFWTAQGDLSSFSFRLERTLMFVFRLACKARGQIDGYMC